MSCLVKCNMSVNAQLSKGFRSISRGVLNHQLLCIFGTIGFMNMSMFGVLLGNAELRNEEVLLPNDAREIDTQKAHRELFGWDTGFSSMLIRTDGNDLLTKPSLESLALMEAEVLAVTVADPDDAHIITFQSTCERMWPAGDGPCMYQGFFGPGTPWNPIAADGTHLSPADSATAFFDLAATLEATRPPGAVNGIHLAATQLYSQIKSNMWFQQILGGVELNAAGQVTKVSDISLSLHMAGVERKTLVFDMWDVVMCRAPYRSSRPL
jgi:hypothetical protein